MSTSAAPSTDLFKQTLRTVIVLVTACVVFVGALSGAAVAITSRAFSSPSGSAGTDETSATANAKIAKPDVTPAKKPQSI
jgi:hypothetical protein